MKLTKTYMIPLCLGIAALPLSGETIFIDFEDSDELTNNWIQTTGLPDDSFVLEAGAGVSGSVGLVHVDGPQDFQVTFVHQTDIGGFKDGLSMYVKARVVQVGAGSMMHFGFATTADNNAGIGGDTALSDWMGVNLNFRSNLTSFRAMPTGNDVIEDGTSINYWAGPGHPESFVDLPDGNGGFADGVTPVDVWFGFELIFIDEGDGDWDIQTKIDVLSADGSAVAIDDYAVFNYSTQEDAEDPATKHPPLVNFSDFYNATSLYPFVATGFGEAGNLASVDEITITIPEESKNWNGYPVGPEGYADTGDWMGYVWVESDPWVYNVDLSKWIYVAGSEGWVYIPK